MSLEILLAMTFLTVLIHFACVPTSEPIERPQKIFARAWPIADFLLICNVQFKMLVLLVMHRTTRWGSLLTLLLEKEVSAAVVYYDCDVLETVYGYEILIQMFLEMKKTVDDRIKAVDDRIEFLEANGRLRISCFTRHLRHNFSKGNRNRR